MTAEREALDLAKSAIERLEQAVSLLDDTFFYTEGYHKSIVEFTDRFAKIDQALANPATIRDTDEDAVGADMRGHTPRPRCDP